MVGSILFLHGMRNYFQKFNFILGFHPFSSILFDINYFPVHFNQIYFRFGSLLGRTLGRGLKSEASNAMSLSLYLSLYIAMKPKLVASRFASLHKMHPAGCSTTYAACSSIIKMAVSHPHSQICLVDNMKSRMYSYNFDSTDVVLHIFADRYRAVVYILDIQAELCRAPERAPHSIPSHETQFIMASTRLRNKTTISGNGWQLRLECVPVPIYRHLVFI